MIGLTRKRTKTAIVKSFRAETSVSRLADLMKERRQKLIDSDELKFKFKSKWGVTKKQLSKETHGKCAYCETSYDAVAFGDVEHFRPKSVYWWLAYVYDNYLASCQICNQQFKSNIFEVAGQKMKGPHITKSTSDNKITQLAEKFAPDPLDSTAISNYEAAHRAEKALIPNPYIDDPEKIFAWEVFVGAKEVHLVPNEDFVDSEIIVEASNRIYGLNRPQLLRRRFDQWRFYRLSVGFLEDPDASEENRLLAEEFIKESLQPESQYAGMIRFFEKRRLADNT